jgi:hypothetical protein
VLNAQSARAFEKLPGRLEKVPETHPAFEALRRFHDEPVDSAHLEWVEAQSRYIRRYGFDAPEDGTLRVPGWVGDRIG